jgi:hypothetical protein
MHAVSTELESQASTRSKQPMTTVRTAVAGVGGYAGGELARLLLAHPRLAETKPLFLGRVADEASSGRVPLEQLQPQLALGQSQHLPEVRAFTWDLIREAGTEIVFLALPHETSREWAPAWIERGIRVIDLSGAWRLDESANRAVYKLHDADPALGESLQTEAVYGSPRPSSSRSLLCCVPVWSTSTTESYATRSRASAVQARRRPRRRTLCMRRRISLHTRSSGIATPARCWSSLE